MSSHTAAALIVELKLNQDYHDLFNQWHTFEHIPQRMSINGFTDSRRFYCPARKQYLCLYSLADPAVLTGPDYLSLQQRPASEAETSLAGSIILKKRRVADEIFHCGDGLGAQAVFIEFYLSPGQQDFITRLVNDVLPSLYHQKKFCCCSVYFHKEKAQEIYSIIIYYSYDSLLQHDSINDLSSVFEIETMHYFSIDIYSLQYSISQSQA